MPRVPASLTRASESSVVATTLTPPTRRESTIASTDPAFVAATRTAPGVVTAVLPSEATVAAVARDRDTSMPRRPNSSTRSPAVPVAVAMSVSSAATSVVSVAATRTLAGSSAEMGPPPAVTDAAPCTAAVVVLVTSSTSWPSVTTPPSGTMTPDPSSDEKVRCPLVPS